MQGTASFDSTAITLRTDPEWFEHPRHRDASQWAAHQELLTSDVDGTRTLRLPLTRWEAWGTCPAGSEPERVDAWSFEHEAVARLLGIPDETLSVQTIGHVGGGRMRVELSVNGSPLDLLSSSPPKFVTQRGQPVLLSPLASRVARRLYDFAQAEEHSRAEQLQLIGELKRLRNDQRQLSTHSGRLRLHLDAHLESFEIIEPERFAMRWADEGRNRVSLQLFVEGEEQALPLGDLDERAPVIESGRRVVMLDTGTEVAARRARELTQVRREKVGEELLRSPIGIVPEGVETPRLDFSQYSHRVLGFEPATREGSSFAYTSGIAWYQKDDDGLGRIVLTVSGVDGSPVSLSFDEPARALAAAERLEEAVQRGDAVAEIEGQRVAAKPEQAKQLRELVQRNYPAPIGPDDLAGRGRNEAAKKTGKAMRAVLADVNAQDDDRRQAFADADLEAAVPWPTLDAVLSVSLKPHQREGIAWLWHRYTRGASGAVLADDMGLGKTLQIASFVSLLKGARAPDAPKRPTLIVAPVVLIANWARELGKFFVGSFPGRLKELRDEALRGMRMRDGQLDRELLRTFDVVVTSYEALARHAMSLLGIEWDVVVLDEAHRIKNRGTQWSIAARGLSGLAGTDRPRKFQFAICSTGTPVENAVTDLWALYDFVSPGQPFGSYEDFRRLYERDDEAPRLLSERLQVGSKSSSLLRRDKSQVLRDFPPKRHETLQVAMTPFQRDQERAIVHSPVSRAGGSFKILEQLQKLYQHPWLLEDERAYAGKTHHEALEASPKLRACIDLLEKIRNLGEKALIFTLWTRMQWLLKDVIESHFGLQDVPVINGDPQNSKRAQARIDALAETSGFAVMILSPLAAGVGLTITAANHVIHYGRWWNPAKEDQATDRAYRIGQQRPVTVYYPVLHHPGDLRQGFDVKLDELVKRKRAMGRQLLEPVGDGEPSAADLSAIGLGGGR